ncbi:MAG: ribonuclease III [Planctomycetota bacterium]
MPNPQSWRLMMNIPGETNTNNDDPPMHAASDDAPTGDGCEDSIGRPAVDAPASSNNDLSKDDQSTSIELPLSRDELMAGPYGERLLQCEQRIGYQFENPNLLLAALTHASGAMTRLHSNERLEFLGDSVLGVVICAWLFHRFPKSNEGDLTKIKSDVVSGKSCAIVVRQLGLDKLVIVGRGVQRSRPMPASIVSDVLESIIGAIYLDGGLEPARERILSWMEHKLEMVELGATMGNHKSLLQQQVQKEGADSPRYRLLNEMGPDHAKFFRVCAVVGDTEYTAAWGSSKKQAQQRAAENALAEMNGDAPPHDERSAPW